MEHIDENTIEQFLLGKMEATEEIRFKEQLLADPDLSQRVEQQKALIQGIQLHQRNKVLSQFDAIENELKTSKENPIEEGKTRQVFPLKYSMIAASIVLLGFVGWWWYRSQPADTDQLFARYATHYDSGVGTRNIEDSCEWVTHAVLPYNNKKYKEAIGSLKQLLGKDIPAPCLFSEDDVPIMIGISYLFANQPDSAISFLSPLTPENQTADWYLTLAHLKNQNLPQVRNKLQRWEGKVGYYGERAKALLEALD